MNDAEQLEHLNETMQIAGLSPRNVVLPTGRQLIVNNIRLNLLEWGPADAPPIVFMHGGNLNAHTWDLTCVVLSDRYRCIAVDMRGHGDSEWAADVDYSFPTMEADLKGVVDALELHMPVVVGMSYGGLVSIKFAGDHSSEMSGLVIVDTGPDIRTHGAEEIREFTQNDQIMDSVEDFVNRAIRFNSRRRPELLRRSLLHNLRMLPSGRWTWKWDWRRLHDYDLKVLGEQMAVLWQSVVLITCPTLIVRGEYSNVFLPEDAEKLSAALPGSKLEVVANSGHTVQGDNVSGLLDVLEPFVSEAFAAWTP